MKIDISGWAWFDKSELSKENIAWLKEALTLKQKVSREYQNRSKGAEVPLFVEEDSRFGIPREYFFNSVTKDHDVTYNASSGEEWPDRLPVQEAWQKFASADPKQVTGFDINSGNPLVMRPQQDEALQATLNHFKDKSSTGGLIQLPTGAGKTTLAIELIRRLRLKSAVLVHRDFLLNQWRKRINQYFPDMKVGVIQGKEWDVEGCHVVLVMIQTIASWVKKNKLPEGLSDMFGLVCLDEVHRGGAPHWSLAIPAFNPKYRLGISAHPKRSDGLDKVFFYHVGPKLYTGTQLMRVPKIRRVWTNYKLNHPRFNPTMMSMEFAFKLMSADPGYNQEVVNQIKLALDKERKILVYSHTVNHLKRLKEDVDSQFKQRPIKTTFFIGGMTEDELDESNDADCVFATLQMAKDSLDIPQLDTVVLAAPIRNPQQPAGRACRDYPNKKDPIVVDMRADGVPVFKDYGESRDNAYVRLYGDTVKAKSSGSSAQQTLQTEIINVENNEVDDISQ